MLENFPRPFPAPGLDPDVVNTPDAARHVESQLFEHVAAREGQARPIFILGSPRTGSTLLYLSLIHI